MDGGKRLVVVLKMVGKWRGGKTVLYFVCQGIRD